MGLKNMSIISAGSVTASGGAALTFAEDGVSVPNGIHLIVPNDADYQTRRQLTVKVRQPTLDPKTGQYSKDKKSMCLAMPIVLSDGRVVFNTIRIEREMHPSVTPADCVEFNKLGSQLLFDTDTDGFWATGSLS